MTVDVAKAEEARLTTDSVPSWCPDPLAAIAIMAATPSS
jgi:hypothetical protein